MIAANVSLADAFVTPEMQGCKFPSNYSNDGPLSMNGYSNWIEVALDNVDTNGGALLKSYAEAWNDPSCVLVDGRPRLSGMLKGITNSFYYNGGQDWNKNIERINKLKSTYPNIPISAIAEAQYWFDYAWDARGSGYSSTVTGDGMKLFHERLKKAAKVLDDSKAYASALPVWYEVMLKVKSAQGLPERERDAILVEGVSKYKWYIPLYFTRANFLTPWWGGNWDTIENLAVWSVDQTKADMGSAMYARIYWTVSGYTQVSNIFKDTKASWTRMKIGFDDILKKHPDSKWNLNAYARFACDAGDKATYLKLRKRLTVNDPDPTMKEAWGKNSPKEVCDAKFGYRN